jgi:hypothetical protein
MITTHDRNDTTAITLSILKRITMRTTTSLTTRRHTTRAQARAMACSPHITGKTRMMVDP